MFALVLLVCSLFAVIILDKLLEFECFCMVWCYCRFVGSGCEWASRLLIMLFARLCVSG